MLIHKIVYLQHKAFATKTFTTIFPSIIMCTDSNSQPLNGAFTPIITRPVCICTCLIMDYSHKLSFLKCTTLFKVGPRSLTLQIKLVCNQCDQIGWFIGLWASKPLVTINLTKYCSFLGNFCKGVKIYHFSSEINTLIDQNKSHLVASKDMICEIPLNWK